jgi:catalase
MNPSFNHKRWIGPGISLLAAGMVLAAPASAAEGQGAAAKPLSEKELAQQIFDTMLQVPGTRPGFRPVHAKGLVCKGTFAPAKEAAGLSKAAHFQETSVPITVRFSDGSPDPAIPDNSPNAGPRGMAIRFQIPGGRETDIVAMSHNGFVVSDGAEFLALQKAVVATDPGKPHPWPIEEFLTTHPAALKFVQDNRVVPASFATELFFSNNSFLFVNNEGKKQPGRYRILPLEGPQNLSEAEAKDKPANFLGQEFRTRLAAGPVKFRLVIQLPNPGDPTKDSSIVWAEDRRTIDAGTLTVVSVVADSEMAEKELAFDPTNLIDGIEQSDDPLPSLRSRVYALSVRHRRQK